MQGELLNDKLANLAREVKGLERFKPRSKREILKQYAKSVNAELRTVEKQYERGRRIFQKSQQNAPETPE